MHVGLKEMPASRQTEGRADFSEVNRLREREGIARNSLQSGQTRERKHLQK